MLIDPEAPTFDARALNWRFVTPSEPTGMLLLPAENERISFLSPKITLYCRPEKNGGSM